MINQIYCVSLVLQNVVAAAAAESDESAESSDEDEVRDKSVFQDTSCKIIRFLFLPFVSRLQF